MAKENPGQTPWLLEFWIPQQQLATKRRAWLSQFLKRKGRACIELDMQAIGATGSKKDVWSLGTERRVKLAPSSRATHPDRAAFKKSKLGAYQPFSLFTPFRLSATFRPLRSTNPQLSSLCPVKYKTSLLALSGYELSFSRMRYFSNSGPIFTVSVF